jgi:hypothetical protein
MEESRQLAARDNNRVHGKSKARQEREECKRDSARQEIQGKVPTKRESGAYD